MAGVCICMRVEACKISQRRRSIPGLLQELRAERGGANIAVAIRGPLRVPAEWPGLVPQGHLMSRNASISGGLKKQGIFT